MSVALATPMSSDSASFPAPTALRLTPQRQVVYSVVQGQTDHPTATDVYQLAKAQMPSISLATVYNCLEALCHAHLVRQVNMDRLPSRYCRNLADHAHFYCDTCDTISDVPLGPDLTAATARSLPRGSSITKMDVTLHGCCAACAKKKKSPARN